MSTASFTLTASEKADGLTLATVKGLARATFKRDDMVILPVGVPDALAGAVARFVLGSGATFSHLASGRMPVYVTAGA